MGNSLRQRQWRGPRGLRVILGFACVAALAVAISACGGGGSSSGTSGTSDSGGSTGSTGDTSSPGDGVATAKKAVAALEAPVKFEAPGDTIEVGDKLKGKTIYVVANGLNFPFVQAMLKALKEGAALVGANVVAVDGAGETSKASSLVEQGIARNASVIVTQSFPSEQLAAALKSAKAAGIPVVELTSRDPELPDAKLKALGVSAIASFCYECAGREMAQAAVAASEGDVDSVLYNVPEIGVSALELRGYTEELESLCPECSVQTVDAPLAQWNTNLPSLTTSSIQSDPNVNFLVPLYDAMVPIIAPAVATAQSDAEAVTYNATEPVLEMLQKGEFVAGDVGGMNEWLGWATMDQVARLLTGNPPVADEKIPNRLFTQENIGEVDLKEAESSWYGDLDLEAEYKSLWGL